MCTIGAESLPLPVVSNDESHFHIAIVGRSKTRQPDDLSAVPVVVLCDERQLSSSSSAGYAAGSVNGMRSP